VRTSGLAIASLVCGILGFLCLPVSIAGVICGHLALSGISKSQGQLTGRGMAIAGLTCSYLKGAVFLLGIVTAIISGISKSH